MKKILIILMVALLAAGCEITQQSLLQELRSNPNPEIAQKFSDFLQDYDENPAESISVKWSDGTVKTSDDPVLISRLYRNILGLGIKKKSTLEESGPSDSPIMITLAKGSQSVDIVYDNKRLIVGEVVYELGTYSKFDALLNMIKEDATPVHTLEASPISAEILSMVRKDESYVAEVKVTNTTEASILEYGFTIVFIDEAGRVQATKKVSQKLGVPLDPSKSQRIEVNCDYKEEIADLRFQLD